MHERPRINVKVERGSTLTYMRDLPYNVYFIHARKIYVRTYGKITRQQKSTFQEVIMGSVCRHRNVPR